MVKGLVLYKPQDDDDNKEQEKKKEESGGEAYNESDNGMEDVFDRKVSRRRHV
jgi:hypothetical protein